jgi:hypothetical protein
MSYFNDVGDVTAKDPVTRANKAIWFQQTGGHVEDKWSRRLLESIQNVTLASPYPATD